MAWILIPTEGNRATLINSDHVVYAEVVGDRNTGVIEYHLDDGDSIFQRMDNPYPLPPIWGVALNILDPRPGRATLAGMRVK